MVKDTTIYHEKAKELGNMLLSSEAYRRLIVAREAYSQDAEANELNKKIADFNNSLQFGIKMGTLTTDEYREAIVELSDMERKLQNNEAVKEYFNAEEEYNQFVGSVMGIVNKILDNMGKSLQGGPKMCTCGSNPDGPCYSSCGSSTSGGGCGSGCSCV
ncbi:MAG: YlbF family regulator [Defluviitaleaceae bacterium]|nr:YlbF family regulator [Defluviitaleaceae bacterium]